jgi:hypothetical protein
MFVYNRSNLYLLEHIKLEKNVLAAICTQIRYVFLLILLLCQFFQLGILGVTEPIYAVYDFFSLLPFKPACNNSYKNLPLSRSGGRFCSLMPYLSNCINCISLEDIENSNRTTKLQRIWRYLSTTNSMRNLFRTFTKNGSKL